MVITFLGTGTSQGVPVIGCSCETCKSMDIRDHRLRSSLLIKDSETSIVIDVGPDFRQQILTHPIDYLHAVLLTHEHNDHVIGLDDTRPFYFRQKEGIDFFASENVFSELKVRFPYAFSLKAYPGAPKIKTNLLTPYNSFDLENLRITPIPIYHGKLEIFAFRVNNFTYITDGSSIPDDSLEIIKGSEVLVINALRKSKHYSHFNLNEALEIIQSVNPREAYITHISHLMGCHKAVQAELPPNVFLAYDGLSISLR